MNKEKDLREGRKDSYNYRIELARFVAIVYSSIFEKEKRHFNFYRNLLDQKNARGIIR